MIADGAKIYRDREQKVPYLVKKDQWIGYDDVESFTKKVYKTFTSFVRKHIVGSLSVFIL